MEINDSYIVNTGIENTWRLLNDPDVLARVIPGVKKLLPVDESVYDVELQIGMGAVRGIYNGRVEVTHQIPPESYTLKIQGDGPGAFVKGTGQFHLKIIDNESTRVDFQGEAQVGGVLARVGQRMLGGAAKTLADQFFSRLNKEAANI